MSQLRSEIVKIPYAEAYAPGFEDMPRRVPDLSKISNMIGYTPTLRVAEIVDQVVAYFGEHPEFK